jgi:hypothetical protein
LAVADTVVVETVGVAGGDTGRDDCVACTFDHAACAGERARSMATLDLIEAKARFHRGRR